MRGAGAMPPFPEVRLLIAEVSTRFQATSNLPARGKIRLRYDQPGMKKRTAVLLIISAYVLGIASPYIAYWGWAAVNRRLWPGEQISRLTSPDGVLDAVVVRVDKGALGSNLYYLYIVPRGTGNVESSGEDPMMETSEGDELKVRWEKPHFLAVDIADSHVKSFVNLWYSKKVDDYFVELVLSSSNGKHYLQDSGRLRGEH